MPVLRVPSAKGGRGADSARLPRASCALGTRRRDAGDHVARRPLALPLAADGVRHDDLPEGGGALSRTQNWGTKSPMLSDTSGVPVLQFGTQRRPTAW
eukprot:SAG31_NODE_379_length_16485_cov_3.654583_11_plen_98_part_00